MAQILSRGLARALIRQYPDAIEDFKQFGEWSKKNNANEENRSEREAWIRVLEEGRNPFNSAILKALRKQ